MLVVFFLRTSNRDNRRLRCYYSSPQKTDYNIIYVMSYRVKLCYVFCAIWEREKGKRMRDRSKYIVQSGTILYRNINTVHTGSLYVICFLTPFFSSYFKIIIRIFNKERLYLTDLKLEFKLTNINFDLTT